MKTYLTPAFIGRHDEIQQLTDTLNTVQAGHGRCVLVSGEAGIGKSRLLAEIQNRAAQKGFRTLTGRCFEQDRSFPYAPLVDMLRSFFGRSSVDAPSNALSPLAPTLVKLLPELAPSSTSTSSSSMPPESELEKRQLFTALTDLFRRQAEMEPLLVIVEDLHWSDQASLEFLLYLVRRIAEQPVFLLLSSRPADRQAELRDLLTGLDREPIAQRLPLAPLAHAEISHLIKAILDQPQEPSAEFVTAVYGLTEGNPFFAEEICTSLIASGDIYYQEREWRRKPLSQIEIPDSLQRMIQRRLERISQPARQLIDLAAISGRSFDFAVLQFLTGHSDQELSSLIKELMTARLVTEESANQFSFRHALTREALYTQLLVRERQALHGQLVQAIERVHADSLESHLEALAYHTYVAALWQKNIGYAQRAGEKALELFAPHAAIMQLTRGIEAVEKLSQAPSSTLYRLRGQAFDTLGNFDQARADYEAALHAAEASGDQHTAWQALLDLGLLWASRDYARTGGYCRQALELARTMEDANAIGYSLIRLGNWLLNNGRPFEALDKQLEALALFEEIDDRAGVAATLDLLAMASAHSGNVVEAVTYYERAVPILRELNNWQTLSSTLANLSQYTLDLEQANEAIKLARDIGWQSGEAYALNALSWALFSRGRYGQSLTLRTQGLELAQAIEHRQWMASSHIALGAMYLELMALTRAENHLAEGLALAKQVGSTFFSWQCSGYLALVYILQGQLEAAETLLAELPQEWIPTLYTVRFAQIELALAQKDPARMLQLLDDLLSMPFASERAIGMLVYFGPVLILHGQALLLLGRPDEANQVLLQAVGLFTKHGIVHRLWRIYIALGKTHLSASRAEKAREMFVLARNQIHTLAATIDEEVLRDNFLRRATAMIPEVQPLTPRQAVKQEFGGLTRRERQVAAVVAQGLTNQEIADELVVSIKTVEAHVTRILSKLGFSSRAQIAAWAVDKGLASAPSAFDL